MVTDGQVRRLLRELDSGTSLATAAGRAEPRLLAKTLFEWLRREHPGQFLDSHRRTFERRVRQSAVRRLAAPGSPSCSARFTRPAA